MWCRLMCVGVGSRVGFPASGRSRWREVGGHLLYDGDGLGVLLGSEAGHDLLAEAGPLPDGVQRRLAVLCQLARLVPGDPAAPGQVVHELAGRDGTLGPERAERRGDLGVGAGLA